MIIVLVGLMGSGKSTIGSRLADDLGYHFLEISDQVRAILSSQSRSSMVQESLQNKQKDPMWLAEPIRLKLQEHKNWVISGVREVVLLDMIRDLGQKVHVIELRCSDRTRLKRCKDKYTSLDALRKADSVDMNLGIQQVVDSADMTLGTNGTLKRTRSDLLAVVEALVELD